MSKNKESKNIVDFRFNIEKHFFIFCPLVFFFLLITRTVGRTYEFGNSVFNEKIYSYNLISVFLSMSIYMIYFIFVWFYTDYVCSNRSIIFKTINLIIYYFVSFIEYLLVGLYQSNFGFFKSNYPYYIDKFVFLLPIICYVCVILKLIIYKILKKTKGSEEHEKS